MTKRCTKCGKEKPLNEFHRMKRGPQGHDCSCKVCKGEYIKIYRKTEKGRMLNLNSVKRYAQTSHGKEKIRVYRESEKGIASARLRQKKYRATDRGRMKHAQDAVNSYRTVAGQVRGAMSSATYAALKGHKSGRCWEEVVGYNLTQLRRHLEAQFLCGMSWDNYGAVWHIDHIVPQSFFEFELPTDTEFRYCWSLHNLMPRFATNGIAGEFGSKQEGNLNKHAKVEVLQHEVST